MVKRWALGLDGLLSNKSLQLEKYQAEAPKGASAATMYGNDQFWATMPVYEDIEELRALIDTYGTDFFVLTERPKKLELVTFAWLKRNFYSNIIRKQIIYNTIKRFDCRINNIELHIDTEFVHEEWYKFDNMKAEKWIRNNN